MTLTLGNDMLTESDLHRTCEWFTYRKSVDQIVQLSFISLIINIVGVNSMVLKGIINITQSSPLANLAVLTIVAIPAIMTISMHGYVLADGESGYQLTVNVPSYPSGTSTLGISITTANGYTDHANLATSSGISWTFNIPANQGSSVPSWLVT